MHMCSPFRERLPSGTGWSDGIYCPCLYQACDVKGLQCIQVSSWRLRDRSSSSLQQRDQPRMTLPSAHDLMDEGRLRSPTRPGNTHTLRPNERRHCE